MSKNQKAYVFTNKLKLLLLVFVSFDAPFVNDELVEK
jgi:hypothetical protein